jgi:hypothetical protein
VIDYIQYEGEKKDFSPYSTAHPRAFGFIRLLFFLFFFYGLHKSYLPAQKTDSNIFWQLNLHGNNYANSA